MMRLPVSSPWVSSSESPAQRDVDRNCTDDDAALDHELPIGVDREAEKDVGEYSKGQEPHACAPHRSFAASERGAADHDYRNRIKCGCAADVSLADPESRRVHHPSECREQPTHHVR